MSFLLELIQILNSEIYIIAVSSYGIFEKQLSDATNKIACMQQRKSNSPAKVSNTSLERHTILPKESKTLLKEGRVIAPTHLLPA